MQTIYAAATAVAAMVFTVIIVIVLARIVRHKDADSRKNMPGLIVAILALGVTLFLGLRAPGSGEKPGGLGDIRAGGNSCIDTSGTFVVLAPCNNLPAQTFISVATGALAQSKLKLKDEDRCLVALTENTVGTDECKSAQPWEFDSMNSRAGGRTSWAIKYKTTNGVLCLTLPPNETRIIMDRCDSAPSEQTQQWWIRAS